MGTKNVVSCDCSTVQCAEQVKRDVSDCAVLPSAVQGKRVRQVKGDMIGRKRVGGGEGWGGGGGGGGGGGDVLGCASSASRADTSLARQALSLVPCSCAATYRSHPCCVFIWSACS